MTEDGSMPVARYGSFVVQTRSERGPGGVRVTGVIENLRSGRRTGFESLAELGRLIGDWAEAQLGGKEIGA